MRASLQCMQTLHGIIRKSYPCLPAICVTFGPYCQHSTAAQLVYSQLPLCAEATPLAMLVRATIRLRLGCLKPSASQKRVAGA